MNNKTLEAMTSSKTNEWYTPDKFFNYLNSIYHFTLDPCSTHENAKCEKHYTIEDDGLSKSWVNEIVFVNPPYGGNTKEWLKKCAKESAENNATVVCLIVSATDRSYWHDIIYPFASEIWFLRGRLKFGGSKTTAPFASAIIIFGKKKDKADVYFKDLREFR